MPNVEQIGPFALENNFEYLLHVFTITCIFPRKGCGPPFEQTESENNIFLYIGTAISAITI